jgi:2'-hydroxyisoflavone reductase
VRLLVIGGTQFVGRASVEEATARGHGVTIFHRGRTEPAGLPDVEHVHGERETQLGLLGGRRFDAVLDTCAYVPAQVRAAAAALGGSTGSYALVSTLSVHGDFENLPPGGDESTPTHQPPWPDTEEVDWQTYGPLKAACEEAAREQFGERCLVLRPGYIVGPHDPTDRFTYWVRRAAAGGRMLAPGPPDAPMQFLDVRDMAAFMVSRLEAEDRSLYVLVGPGRMITFGEVLEAARAAAGADTELVWVDAAFVRERLGEERHTALPLWDPELRGLHAFSPARAVAAGLRHRPAHETIADLLAWDRERGLPPLRVGLDQARERELLEAWRAR